MRYLDCDRDDERDHRIEAAEHRAGMNRLDEVLFILRKRKQAKTMIRETTSAEIPTHNRQRRKARPSLADRSPQAKCGARDTSLWPAVDCVGAHKGPRASLLCLLPRAFTSKADNEQNETVCRFPWLLPFPPFPLLLSFLNFVALIPSPMADTKRRDSRSSPLL